MPGSEIMPPRSHIQSLGLIFPTAAAGLAIRFAPLGLPPFVVKYGGSTLWAVMIYWIVSTLLPLWRLPAVALLAGALATAVEFVKLCHFPALEAFRATLPGIILLGRSSPSGTSSHTGSPSLLESLWIWAFVRQQALHRAPAKPRQVDP